ncbi:hypothetical protein ACJDU8_13075 [Clostridium sp. WILCCON 0269]|uniref:Uncharacterized protein n=1 Tax=Candidatus Clostridium eludens TaxID=3381663 RepID=A0ABW8SK85_9CLOT
MDNFNLLSDMVEASTKPILDSTGYWQTSILNVLKAKREEAKDINTYTLELKADIVYIMTVWKKQRDIIYTWVEKSELPPMMEINDILTDIENKSETEVVNGKVVLKTGERLNENALNVAKKYNFIENINKRAELMEREYFYCRIRDNIILNVYQFLWEHGELADEVVRECSIETVDKVSNLISRCADECIKVNALKD